MEGENKISRKIHNVALITYCLLQHSCVYIVPLYWVDRKLRESMNAQKNAQRAAMRAHFRRKYQLSEVCCAANFCWCVCFKS